MKDRKTFKIVFLHFCSSTNEQFVKSFYAMIKDDKKAALRLYSQIAFVLRSLQFDCIREIAFLLHYLKTRNFAKAFML